MGAIITIKIHRKSFLHHRIVLKSTFQGQKSCLLRAMVYNFHDTRGTSGTRGASES